MSRLATLVVAVGALALAFVTLSPNSAEAGWRRWGWGPGPGVNVYVGPRLVRLSALLPSLCLSLRLSLRLLPLLARTLLARLVLGTQRILRARGSLLTLGANEGCRLSPQGGGPSFLLAEIERLTAT